MAVLRFNGVQIGDSCSDVQGSVARAVQPEVQNGVARLEALLSDSSPNLYYKLKARVHYKAGSMLDLVRWCTSMGALMARGLQVVEVVDGGDTLTMEAAAMVGSFESNNKAETNAALARNIEVEFWSIKKPA